jgi:hypothetical protein
MRISATSAGCATLAADFHGFRGSLSDMNCSFEMKMDRQRWRQVETHYHAALDHESGAREVFLAQACAEDEELRREVEELLRFDSTADGFIEGDALAFEARPLEPQDSRERC